MTMTPEELEAEILSLDDPVFSVPELAAKLEPSDTRIRQILEALELVEKVERKDVGARATAWWSVERVTPEEHPDQSDLRETASSEEPVSDERDDAGEQGTAWTVEEAAEWVDVPGWGNNEDDRRDAIAGLLRDLRDAGVGTKSDLAKTSHESGTTHYANAESWWVNCARPALTDLTETGAVTLEDYSKGLWKWTGE